VPNVIKVSRPNFLLEDLTEIGKILESGILANGPYIEKFQSDLEKYFEVSHAIATANGTSALHTALIAWGIGKGDYVAVPSYTFFATVEAILQVGAIPLFLDLDIDTWNMDPENLVKFLENHNDKVKACIVVHLFGNPANMKKFQFICKSYEIILIEDCAQAHGAQVGLKKVGTMSDVSIFSFFATKNLSTGEGGALLTSNHHRAITVRQIINHGMSDRNTHKILGYNYRMSEIEAALGISQLKYLDKNNKTRIKNSNYLRENLKDIVWLVPQRIESNAKHVFFACPFLAVHKTLSIVDLREQLLKNGVETRFRYNKPIYEQPVLKKFKHKIWKNENVQHMAGKMLGLPNHTGLFKEELDKIIEVFHNVS